MVLVLFDLFSKFAKTKEVYERFGDWCIRMNIIEPTLDGKYFWSKGEDNLVHDKLQIYW